MASITERWFSEFLRCPDCSGELVLSAVTLGCRACEFERLVLDQIDLRPINPHLAEFSVSRTPRAQPASCLASIETKRPKITYRGPPAQRDSSELMSAISEYLNKGGKVLDLGCGPRDQAIPIEFLSYKYIGVDYTSESADLLADAHSIPFRTATFDCVLSYAVLEHLHNPFVAIREIERVLKPGGVFVGTVSQGEPFHASYFHHTAWGVISLVTSATSMSIRRLWDSGDTLHSLARMGRYPKIIKIGLKSIAAVHEKAPFLAPRRVKWPKEEKRLDRIYRAGSICFLIQKLPT